MVETEVGKLEARVTVKGDSISDADYYLNDKKLTEMPSSKIPKSVRACLNKSRRAAADSWFAGVRDLVVPSAEAAKRCIAHVVGHPGCDESICCAKACCGNACAVWCAYI